MIWILNFLLKMFNFVMLRMPSSDNTVSQLKTHLLNTKGNLKIKEEFSVC